MLQRIHGAWEPLDEYLQEVLYRGGLGDPFISSQRNGLTFRNFAIWQNAAALEISKGVLLKLVHDPLTATFPVLAFIVVWRSDIHQLFQDVSENCETIDRGILSCSKQPFLPF